jgi:hypothetical protein
VKSAPPLTPLVDKSIKNEFIDKAAAREEDGTGRSG